jgi:hypothetical protein
MSIVKLIFRSRSSGRRGVQLTHPADGGVPDDRFLRVLIATRGMSLKGPYPGR